MTEPPTNPRADGAPSMISGTDGGPSIGRTALIAGAITAVAVTFLFRYLTVEYTNDHFVHLSRGAQILYGDVPTRDFFDPGLIGQYYASAAALLWSGHNLFGETLLTVGFIAAGAGLTFVAAARLSGSIWLATAATAAAVLSLPRLYSYPKVFFYVAAIVVAWYYASRPSRARLTGLAVITVVAFFFRHDHGVYIGLANVVLLAMLHWPQPKQMVTTLLQYSAITLVLMLPFLVFVQSTFGLLRYVSYVGRPPVQVVWMPVSIDLSAPLVAVPPPAGPRVNVRWGDDIDSGARQQLESRHDLVNAVHVDGSTWSYVPTHLDREHIGALLDDPAVADTHGIDRAGRALEGELPWYLELHRRFPLLRVQFAPGVFSRGNADAWFYYVTLLLPPVGLVIVALLSWLGLIGRTEAAVAGMTCVLGLIIVQTLVRGSPDSRLPDVAGPIFVIGAWVSARALGASPGAGRIARRTIATLVSAAVLVTLWSVATFAHVSTSVETSRILAGPAGVWHRIGEVAERLSVRPIDSWTQQARGIGAVMRYVFECTADTDRLLVTWFGPEVYFSVERPFAGGQVYLHNGWHSSPADQQLTIEWLGRQRVPIVLERNDFEYAQYFPLLADYVHSRYQQVPISADLVGGFRVLVDPAVPSKGTYEPFGAPCYR
jgi:hypothetical protein